MAYERLLMRSPEGLRPGVQRDNLVGEILHRTGLTIKADGRCSTGCLTVDTDLVEVVVT